MFNLVRQLANLWLELDHQQCYPQDREDGETEALEIKYIYQVIIVFFKMIIITVKHQHFMIMIMITSKCFILLLLPPPVSCV